MPIGLTFLEDFINGILIAILVTSLVTSKIIFTTFAEVLNWYTILLTFIAVVVSIPPYLILSKFLEEIMKTYDLCT